MSGRSLVRALRDPAGTAALDAAGWTGLLAAARAEQLLASLAWRLDGLAMPPAVAAILADARASGEAQRTQALWEAEMARRALGDLGVPVVLLKGTAFVAAGLAAGVGRSIGDLDILVPRDALGEVERALLAAGWEWVKPDAYDDAYYRRWMHELPPLIHRTRDRMIDVHHTILPPTARPTPDAAALIAAAVPLGNGLSVLSPADRVVHAAAHLFADGDLAGGLRNLWDIDRLLREGWPEDLAERAKLHGLTAAVARALRLTARLFGTPNSTPFALSLSKGSPSSGQEPNRASTGSARTEKRMSDRLFAARLLARDGWGRPTHPALRFGFYVRSHWLRMPPHLLARHLWTKARKPRGG